MSTISVQSLNQSARPLGLWVIAVGNTVIVALGISAVSPGLQDPLPHAWSLSAAAWAPYILGLLVSILIAAWATFVSSKRFRTVLLALLTILVVLFLKDDLYGVPFLIKLAEKDHQLWRTLSFWWDLSPGVRYLLWLGFNYWYLLRPSTAHTRDRQSPNQSVPRVRS